MQQLSNRDAFVLVALTEAPTGALPVGHGGIPASSAMTMERLGVGEIVDTSRGPVLVQSNPPLFGKTYTAGDGSRYRQTSIKVGGKRRTLRVPIKVVDKWVKERNEWQRKWEEAHERLKVDRREARSKAKSKAEATRAKAKSAAKAKRERAREKARAKREDQRERARKRAKPKTKAKPAARKASPAPKRRKPAAPKRRATPAKRKAPAVETECWVEKGGEMHLASPSGRLKTFATAAKARAAAKDHDGKAKGRKRPFYVVKAECPELPKPKPAAKPKPKPKPKATTRHEPPTKAEKPRKRAAPSKPSAPSEEQAFDRAMAVLWFMASSPDAGANYQDQTWPRGEGDEFDEEFDAAYALLLKKRYWKVIDTTQEYTLVINKIGYRAMWKWAGVAISTAHHAAWKEPGKLAALRWAGIARLRWFTGREKYPHAGVQVLLDRAIWPEGGYWEKDGPMVWGYVSAEDLGVDLATIPGAKIRLKVKVAPEPKAKAKAEGKPAFVPTPGFHAARKEAERVEAEEAVCKPERTDALWKLLVKVIPNLAQIRPGFYFKAQSGAFMDLSVEAQDPGMWADAFKVPPDPGPGCARAFVLIMEHNYIQEGDLMSDPRMDFFVVPAFGSVTPLDFTQHGVPQIYTRAYDLRSDGALQVKLRNKKSLTSFSKMWFKNLHDQGFTVPVGGQPLAADLERELGPTEEELKEKIATIEAELKAAGVEPLVSEAEVAEYEKVATIGRRHEETKHLPQSKIAEAIRADVNVAMKSGEIAGPERVSVTGSKERGLNMIRIVITAWGNQFPIVSSDAVAEGSAETELSERAKETMEEIKRIANVYNFRDESTDPPTSRYHTSVSFAPELVEASLAQVVAEQQQAQAGEPPEREPEPEVVSAAPVAPRPAGGEPPIAAPTDVPASPAERQLSDTEMFEQLKGLLSQPGMVEAMAKAGAGVKE